MPCSAAKFFSASNAIPISRCCRLATAVAFRKLRGLTRIPSSPVAAILKATSLRKAVHTNPLVIRNGDLRTEPGFEIEKTQKQKTFS